VRPKASAFDDARRDFDARRAREALDAEAARQRNAVKPRDSRRFPDRDRPGRELSIVGATAPEYDMV
jgi:hypothetical protein